MTYGQNMLAVKSSWMGQANFNLIPLTMDCPFVEAIFEPTSRNLIVFNKNTQTRFRMLPKIDPNGDAVPAGGKKPRPGGEKTAEERKQMESYTEHYVADKADIQNFINIFVVNPELIDLDTLLKVPEPTLAKA